MTLAERHNLIDTVLHDVEQANPCASTPTLFELASHRLAVEHGLVVTPDEIARVLSRAATLEARP